MAAASAIAMRQAQATEEIGQTLAALNERMSQIESRLGAPIELSSLEIVESEPMATAAQVADMIAQAANASTEAISALARDIQIVNALAEQMNRIEAKLDQVLSSRPTQPHQQPKR